MLGLETGHPVVLTVEDSASRIRPVDQVLTDIQSRVLEVLEPSDGDEVDRFIAERRKEATLELP